MIELRDYQKEAIKKMKDGCILCGGVGSGKSRTALAYYYIQQFGAIQPHNLKDKRYQYIQDLYIITTARKRDTKDWEQEMVPFSMTPDENLKTYNHHIYIDSWNNISKYKDVSNAFFIFDEQRLVGRGEWVKSFLKIAHYNNWILLSATPGDCWNDYVPVFIANGFFKNRTQFNNEHVVWRRFTKFPKIDKYINEGILNKYRDSILVNMYFERDTERHVINVICDYDKILYKDLVKNRWNIEENKPIENASELCYEMRKIVNSDMSRLDEIIDILKHRERIIVFYNYDYELDILKSTDYHINNVKAKVAEWNGHKHELIPNSKYWVYLVQYTAGAEGWNCTDTDTIVFYSLNYSYKIMEQSMGRIDRMNTPFKDLYYYKLSSAAPIDIAIQRALKMKRRFNESSFIGIRK